MKRLFWLMLASLLLLALGGSVVSACGGFFCQNTPIDQSAERIIFTVNDDDTLTAVIGISYQGAAEDFSWLLPVPSVPAVDVEKASVLSAIQAATTPTFTNPPNYCPYIVSCECGGGGGGGGGIITGSAGPYDYVVLTEDDPQVVINWLRDFGYRITDEMIPLIEYYVVVEDMQILAMRLAQGFEAGDIQPVKLTYQGQHPMIPIILTAVAATQDMPILTWIFGDTQYMPDNWAHVEPNFSDFRATSMIVNPFPFWNAQGNYTQEQQEIQADYEGLAFITEYAQPTSKFRELPGIVDEPYLDEISTRFAYVTRLRAQLSPEQMTVDPTFIPSDNLPDVDNNVNLANHVDPLHYWGCSTRSIRSISAEEQLDGYIRVGSTHFAYPNGWTRMELVADGVTVQTFAPRSITADDIAANLRGQSDLPIALYFNPSQSRDNVYGIRGIATVFDIEEMANINPEPSVSQRWLFTTRDRLLDAPSPGEHLFILTTATDYEANLELYDAMIRYFNTYQYYASARLRHTLFLSNRFNETETHYGTIYFAYPDGWIEYMHNEVVTIVPEGYTPDDVNAPTIRLYPLSELTGESDIINIQSITTVADAYALSDEARSMLNSRLFGDGRTQYCQPQGVEPVEYEKDGRRGFLSLSSGHYIEASATSADFDAYADILRLIGGTAVEPFAICG
jgi:hypothetical protein